jgi:AAA domain-containing protein
MFTQPGAVDTAPPASPAAPVAVPMQVPTLEQTAILTAAATGSNLVIEAGAGTGKTTTLRMCAQVARGRSLYVAYNRAIADDARSSFPVSAHCATAHSLAFAAVGRRFEARLRAPRVPAREVARILGIPPVVDLGKQALTSVKVARLVMDTVAGFCHSADDEVGMEHVPPVPGIEGDAWLELRMQAALLARHAWDDLTQESGRLRFTHDVYLKLWALGAPVLPYGTVMLDEAQDANPVIADVIMGQQAQRILVGDRSQAIYGWRGAIDAMDGFLATGATRHVLTQSWRFGQAIADEANQWLDMLDAPLRLTGDPGRDSVITHLPAPDAVLCRSNAGAVGEVIAALEDGRAVAMAGGGDDIRRLAEACRDLRSGKGTVHPELMAFNSWAEVQEYAEHDSGGSDLKVFVKLVDTHGPGAIITLVDRLVPEDAAQVVVSTAHKAKGREWASVRLASDFTARPPVDPETGEVLRPEVMLRYVAVTRARAALDDGSVPAPVVHRTPLGPALVLAALADSSAMDDQQLPLQPRVELPEDIAGWLKVYKDAKAKEAEWKAIKDAAAEKVKDHLGAREEATVGGMPAVSYAWSKPAVQLDGKALKADHPEVYAKYAKEKAAARPFKLTGAWAE